MKPGTIVGGHSASSTRKRAAGGDDRPPPLLKVTEEMAAAAALVAEADAAASAGNDTFHMIQKRAAYWMEGLARKGSVPWGKDGSYKVGCSSLSALGDNADRVSRYFETSKIMVPGAMARQ